jgi:hypothetical protein
MYVCMYVSKQVCKYVCMYVCISPMGLPALAHHSLSGSTVNPKTVPAIVDTSTSSVETFSKPPYGGVYVFRIMNTLVNAAIIHVNMHACIYV